MSFKKILLTLFIVSNFIYASNKAESTAESFKHFISKNKKLSITAACGLSLYLSYKFMTQRITTNLVSENGIEIFVNNFKYLPNFFSTYKLYKDKQYIGVVTSLKQPNNRAILGDLYITQKYRGKGCGTKFLTIVIDNIIKNGIKEIYLDAHPFDKYPNGWLNLYKEPEKSYKFQKLVKFYKNLGFKEISKEEAKANAPAFQYQDKFTPTELNLSCPMKYKIND